MLQEDGHLLEGLFLHPRGVSWIQGWWGGCPSFSRGGLEGPVIGRSKQHHLTVLDQ